MTSRPVRKYNPGFLTDVELLDTFCVRQVEFESLLDTLRGCTGPANQPQILIGPRGSGKTTLLLRVAAELRRDSSLSARFFPVVFAEESYEVSTAGEFWLECLFQLADQAPEKPDGPDLRRTAEALRGDLDDRSLADRCLGALRSFAERENKRLVLFVENLNTLFRDMADSEAGWRLRKVLQTEPGIVLVASATHRFDEMDDPDHAFYDTFRVCVLRRLDTAECATLWEGVSGRKVEHRTIRSLEILTGGSPRLIAIVARFGAAQSFRNLMDELLDLVDDHTEYFRSHLEALPPQERRVYLALADLWHPATTREIAERCRLGTSKCSAQLKRLKERDVVQVEGGTARRKEYYLTERLYNIYYLLRRRRSPTPLVDALIRFMEFFYSPPELAALGAQMARDAAQLPAEIRTLYRSAFAKLAAVPTLTTYRRDLRKVAPDDFAMSMEQYLSSGGDGVIPHEGATKPSPPPSVPSVGPEEDAKLQDLASGLLEASRSGTDEAFNEATASYDAALARLALSEVPARLEPIAAALVNRSTELFGRKQVEAARLVCEDVVSRFGAIEDMRLVAPVLKAMVNKGAILADLDRPDEALEAWDDVVARSSDFEEPSLHETVAISLVNKGMVLARLNRSADVLKACDQVVTRFGHSREPELAKQVAMALVNSGAALSELDRSEDAIAAWDDVVRRYGERKEHPVRECVVKALENKAIALVSLERHENAVAVWDELIHHGDHSEEPMIEPVAKALGSKGVALVALGRAEDALSCWNDLATRFDRKNLPDLAHTVAKSLSNQGTALLALGRPENALAAWSAVVERFGSSDDPEVLKVVATSLGNTAQVFGQTGRPEDALSSSDELLQRFGEHEGAEFTHEVARAFLCKVDACFSLNRPDTALAACDTALDRFRTSDQREGHERVSAFLVNRGMALVALDRPLDAIGSWDDVIRCYGQSDEPDLAESVAIALANKGLALRRIGRLDDAVLAWDEVSRRFLESKSQGLHCHAARALVNKGIVLLDLGEPEKAVEAWTHVVRRFRDSDVPDLRQQCVVALMNTGTTFFRQGKLEAAVTAWDQVVHSGRTDDDLGLLKIQASALASKAVAFVRQENGVDDAMASWDEIVRRFGESGGSVLPEFVAQALVEKAALLINQNRGNEALGPCDEVVRRFGNNEESALRNRIGQALVLKGEALQRMDRSNDALAVYGEAVRHCEPDPTAELVYWKDLALLGVVDIQLKAGQYAAAVETAGLVLGDGHTKPPEVRWRAHLLRAQAVLTQPNSAAAVRDIEELLKILEEWDSPPRETIQSLLILACSVGSEQMIHLIEASPAKDFLLPFSTALRWELGRQPRVPREVEEVAKDLQSELAKLRGDRSIPPD